MPVDIIIVNWNGGPELLEAIESGRRFGANVIVVDNASNGGSIGAVQAMPDVQLVRNAANLGFSIGCNRGVRAGSAEIVMLLNPDAQIISGTAVDLERVFAMSGPVIVGFPIEQTGGMQVRSFGPMPSALTLVADLLRFDSLRRRVGMGAAPAGLALTPGMAWVIGAALAMRRSDWERLGGMDEGFFLWYEDVDLGVRMTRSGGTIALAHGVRIHHVGASTWTRLSRRRRQWLRFLGSRRFAAKHLGPLAVAALVLALPGGLAIGVALDAAHWVTRRP
ncbi:MAG TPA: glycosyltransferase family 2 protein [Candidatus Limnocylindria bacterium]|nr:glycosyltransferase family 2 protein [Candidatus Limnocylindria bacterium]